MIERKHFTRSSLRNGKSVILIQYTYIIYTLYNIYQGTQREISISMCRGCYKLKPALLNKGFIFADKSGETLES